MFIPLEGENIICLANVVAVYRENSATTILKRDGVKEKSSFTPPTLAKRERELAAKGAAYRKRIFEQKEQ
ncbi:MAG: hypothetical protein Q4D58_01465 [Synergistaceae bacterium]|nr:hypothetical protein [Synergistaceae bacterium]